MTKSDWLVTVKAGDQVILRLNTGFRRLQPYVAVVKRVTSTQVLVKYPGIMRILRFRRDNGNPIGDSACSAGTLEQVTPERRVEARRRAVLERLSRVKWEEVGSDQLFAVEAIIAPGAVEA